MKCYTLWQEGERRWLAFGQDPDRAETVIDTNQLLVSDGCRSMLLDPGGAELFPAMVAAVSQEVALSGIAHLFLSHQDPDVASSLPLWRQVCADDLQVHLSWMWTGFISHFDHEARFAVIPDAGAEVMLGPMRLRLLPAHYLHSPGCFCVYDPDAKVLFSGDIGAALVPRQAVPDGIFVTDFAAHVPYMETFHRRWMGSAAARDRWVAMVRGLEVEILAPQHGLLFRGPDVGRFLDWLEALPLGSGIEAFDAVLAGR